MRKTIFIFLVCLSLFFIVLRLSSSKINEYISSVQRSGIRVESNPPGTVWIDSQEMGKVPFQKEDLKKGDHLIEIKDEQGNIWKGYVKLNPGTLTVVNRDLAIAPTSSSGETISLERGKGVKIISNPPGAELEIDGTKVGVTPILVAELSSGEHQFMLSRADFTTRSIRSVMTEGYRLNINVDLSVAEIDLTAVPAASVQSVSQVKVLDTPTGFLRVREAPDTTSSEIGRVAPGDTLFLLEEVPSWKKIKLPDGKQGYVSSQYVEKIQ